jgi:hypothetical protein
MQTQGSLIAASTVPNQQRAVTSSAQNSRGYNHRHLAKDRTLRCNLHGTRPPYLIGSLL